MRRIVILLICVLSLISCAACAGAKRDPAPDPVQSVMSQSVESDPAISPDPGQTGPQNPSTLIPQETKQSHTGYDWYYRRNMQHLVPEASAEAGPWLSAYQAFYVLPNSNKTIYLTFDCGYELGYTSRILDTLKQHRIKAAFFIAGQYIKTRPDLVKRMHEEGHLVCNHTWNHPDLTTLNLEQIQTELNRLDQAYQTITGVPLDRYLRPPMGRYSEASLWAASQAGYKTVFWSLAFKDWDPNQQPGAEASYQEVLNYVHPGAVILLHAVSQSDTEALDKILTDLTAQGYVLSTFH